MTSRVALLLFFLLTLGAGLVHPASATGQYVLTLNLENEGGQPAAGRISVYAGTALCPPVDGDIPVYNAWTGHDFYYADGSIDVSVPAGPVRILVSAGPEHRVHDQTINVGGDLTQTVTVFRLADLRAMGWYGGDTHIHLAHGGNGDIYTITPPDYLTIARAEDLAMSCLLTNGLYFESGAHSAGDADQVLHTAVEYRSSVYGHVGLLGMNALPTAYACCLPGLPAAPLNHDVLGDAQAQGGTRVFAHPLPTGVEDFFEEEVGWPYSGMARELPVDLICGRIDALDILSYSNYGYTPVEDLWFDLLDLGYPLPASVGTDASVNRYFDPPAGGFRVYVKAPALTVQDWLDGLRAGRTFVTNGPLPVQFELDGVEPGGTLDLPANRKVHGSMQLVSRNSVRYLDFYGAGELIKRIPIPAFNDEVNLNFQFTVPSGTGWIVAKLWSYQTTDEATVGDTPLAYTSPIYLTYGGNPPAPKLAALERFDGWIGDLELLLQTREPWESAQQKAEVLAEVATARAALGLHDPVVSTPGTRGPQPELIARPNPAASVDRHGIEVELRTVRPGPGRVELYDVAGRRVRTLWEGVAPEGTRRLRWDGRDDRGLAVAPGVYFLRAQTPSGLQRLRVTILP